MRQSITPLAQEILERYRLLGRHIATAESCTGGLIAAALTSVAGSSEIVEGGFVTYSDASKIRLLGVPASLIATVGAVSAEVAARMAEGALEALPNADIAIAVTGIAGPGGGSAAKPVGLVHFGLAARDAPVESWHHIFPGGRDSVRTQTVTEALLALIRGAAPTSF